MIALLAALDGCGSPPPPGESTPDSSTTTSGEQGGGGASTTTSGGGGGASTTAGGGGGSASTTTGGAGGGASTTAGGGGGGASTTTGGGGSGGSATGAHAAYPVPPDATHFMWQGMQTSFIDETGQPCTASVAIATGDQVVCYAAADGSLRCAGKIYDHVFGPSFTAVDGVEGVQQILLSSTFNAENHNSICVNTATGPACMGAANDWGQFGGGDNNPSPAFVPWGQASGVVALATGTWDQMCAATSGAGQAFCSGYGFGLSPTSVAASAASLWIDTFGMEQANDPTVLRASNGRTDCQVTAQGLGCDVGLMGQPGEVVDGTYTLSYNAPGFPPGSSRYCWLSKQGVVTCGLYQMFPPGPPMMVATLFTLRPVLALAGNPYTTSLCAVYNDGSIACTGANDKGQLGIAGVPYVDQETIVQPPGSIGVECQ